MNRLLQGITLSLMMMLVVAATAQVQPPSDMHDRSIRFTENRGQIIDTRGERRPDILYTTGSGGVQVYLRRSGISYVFTRIENAPDPAERMRPDLTMEERLALDSATHMILYRMDMELVGANQSARVTSDEAAEDYTNYYLGHCPDGITHVRSYGRVIYHEIYPNIDIVLYSNEQGVKYDFVVHPGGRVSDIRLRYVGADSLQLTTEGALRINNVLGRVEEGEPQTYQNVPHEGDTSQVIVESRYHLLGDTISFHLDTYEASSSLVIDPTLMWSTYYGGSGHELLNDGGHVDLSGNLIIAGSTMSSSGNNFPVSTGAFQTTSAGNTEAFLIKMNANGGRIWATYYGGADLDWGLGCSVDTGNYLYMSGATNSSNFPVSSGAFQGTFSGGSSDGFLIKFDSSGTRIWGTYLGGTPTEEISEVVTDSAGNAIVCGLTNGSGLATAGAFQTVIAGGRDGFVAKFSSGGTRLWLTYFGGSAQEEDYMSICLDRGANIILAGCTRSTNLPVTNGAHQSTLNGHIDNYIVKFDSSGTRLWATYIGGQAQDGIGCVTTDLNDNIILVGNTISSNYPTTTGAFQTSQGGAALTFDAIVTKFNPAGTLLWSTYYGGSGNEVFSGVAIARHGSIVATGSTLSSNFPITADAYQPSSNGNRDASVVAFDSSGGRLWSTYLGGSNSDQAASVVVHRGAMYVIGATESSNFPVTSGAFQTSRQGVQGVPDLFITKFCSILLNISLSGPTTFCPGDSVVLTAAASMDSYQWSTGATTRSITVRQPGNYYVVVTLEDCSGVSDTVRVTQYQTTRPIIAVTGGIELCNRDSTTLTIPAFYRSQRWSSGQISNPIVIRSSGIYYVDVIDTNGCSMRSDSVTITVHPRPIATITSTGPLNFCDGDSVVLDAGAGFTSYQWSNGAASQKITAKQSGNFRVIVANQFGCLDTSDVVITKKYPKLEAKIHPLAPMVFCQGDSTFLQALPDGASSYEWSTGDTTRMIVVRQPGSVMLTVTDTNNCTSKDTAKIEILAPPRPRITASGSLRFCAGDSVTLDAGDGYRSYQWSSGERTRIIIVRNTGSYAVTVTDGVGCAGGSDTVRVRVNPKPVIAINGPSGVCANGSGTYSVIPQPGTSYQWSVSGGGGTVISGTGANSLLVQWGSSGTGKVMLTARTDSGCTATATMDVSVGTGLTPTITSSRPLQMCSGDSVELDAGMGYAKYQWSSGETKQRIMVHKAGNYSVWVHDAAGCAGTSKIATVTISNPPVPVITTSNGTTICAGDSTELDAGAGYSSYLWTNGYTTRTVVVRQGGSYAVIVTDTNGCEGASATVVVSVDAAPNPIIQGPSVVCRNSTVSYSVPAMAGSSYQWSVGNGAITAGQGTNSITVQWGSTASSTVNVIETTTRGCSGSAASLPVEVGDRLEPVVTANGATKLCEGTSVELDAGSSYVDYQWSSGETTQRITVTQSGSYSVTVRDANGCSGTSQAMAVSVAAAPVVAISPSGPITLCDGDSVELQAPAGYRSYQWSGGETTPTIMVRSSGSYRVTVTNADGCTGTSQIVDATFNQASKPSITANDDTLVSTLATGYQWLLDGASLVGATSREHISKQSGSYQVRITDASGCTATSDPFVIIGEPVVWFDTASAEVGDRLHLTMHLLPGLKSSDGVVGYSARIRVDGKSLFVHGATSAFAATTGQKPVVAYQADGTITIDYDNQGAAITGAELFQLEMEGLATGIPINEVEIRSVVLKGLGKVPVAGDGLVLLSGCDIANGFDFGRRVRIESVNPNPVTGEAVVVYRAPVGSQPILRLSNVTGQAMVEVKLPVGTGDRQETRVAVGQTASGVYMLELHDRAERSAVPVVITK